MSPGRSWAQEAAGKQPSSVGLRSPGPRGGSLGPYAFDTFFEARFAAGLWKLRELSESTSQQTLSASGNVQPPMHKVASVGHAYVLCSCQAQRCRRRL